MTNLQDLVYDAVGALNALNDADKQIAQAKAQLESQLQAELGLGMHDPAL